MKLYFECASGAAGDMICAALLDLFEDKAAVLNELNGLGLPHTVFSLSQSEQCGIKGAQLSVKINGHEEGGHHHAESDHHHGRRLEDIFEIIDLLNAGEKVKADAKAVYSIVAQAEAKAHGRPAGEVHFHELGMLDAVADVTAASYLINRLAPEAIFASPVNVGSGTVECAHGVLPVPAPATANILLGVPYYKSDIETELCTPTGAALLKHFVCSFTAEPAFEKVTKIGIGAGKKLLPQANVIRVFAFEGGQNTVTELCCNVDDMTGEEIAFAAERMLESGALDCFSTACLMKKGRPGFQLTVLCKNEDAEKFASLIFRHTTTIGIRRYTPSRYTLKRELREDAGIRIKRSEGYGTVREKIEFEDLKKLALENDVSIFEARRMAEKNAD